MFVLSRRNSIRGPIFEAIDFTKTIKIPYKFGRHNWVPGKSVLVVKTVCFRDKKFF